MPNIEDKLKELRKRWLEEPRNRKIIEVQAKLLKMGQEKPEAKKDALSEDMFEVAKAIFKKEGESGLA
jgi:hypothetical protein